MTKVSVSLGLSDVALAKACKRHKVPTPPRGYWARVAVGQIPQKAHLPELRDTELHLERVYVRTSTPTPRTEALRQFSKQSRERQGGALKRHPNAPPFPPVDRVHSALRRTAVTLRRSSTHMGGIAATAEGECGVTVSPAQVERALAFLHVLFDHLETERWAITPDATATLITKGTGKVRFELKEESKLIEHVPTAEEKELDKKQRSKIRPNSADAFFYKPPWPKHDKVWSGKLGIFIPGFMNGVRSSWRDGRTQTVEGMLPLIADGFAAFVLSQAMEEQERQLKLIQAREREHRQELAAARRKREAKRIDLLDELSDTAVRLDRLQSWISRASPTSDQPELARMRDWALSLHSELEARLHGDGLNTLLRSRGLFPDPVGDPLRDPKGDPPEEPKWPYESGE